MQTLRRRFLTLLPKKIRLLISKFKLAIRKPELLLCKNVQYNQAAPLVYILSFPRGGSSWMGSVLGKADNARYLREPITTEFFYHKKQSASVFSKDRCEDWPLYSKLIKQTITAEFPFIDKVVTYPEQWINPKQPKVTVVKEVNPLIINELLTLGIKPIYLVRHPYSVAKSYQALGWDKKNQFLSRLSNQEINTLIDVQPDLFDHDYFFQIGFLQGLIESTVRKQKIHVVHYEELVQDPMTQFSSIFEQYNLIMGDTAKNYIAQSLSNQESTAPGKFSLFRNKKEQSMISISKTEQSNFEATLKGYLSSCRNSQLLTYSNNKYVEFD